MRLRRSRARLALTVSTAAWLASGVLPVACSAAPLAGVSAHPDGGPGDPGSGADAETDGAAGPSADDGQDGSTGGDGGKDAQPGHDASKPPDQLSTAIQIIVEPSDNGAALEAAIGAAKKSVHVTMYLFSSSVMHNALVSAKQRGCDVKVLLNKTFPQGAGSNSSEYSALQSAGIQVEWAPPGYTLTHEKCAIIDGTSAWIMTMNATQSAPSANREYLAVDDDAPDVAEAEAIFAADWANMSFQPTGNLVVSPTNASAKLKGLIDGATSSIDIESEEFSDSVTVNALVARLAAGVKVRLVLSNVTPTPAQQTAVATLKTHGAKVVSLANPYVHAKAMVIDAVRAYVGSQNFTSPSLTGNRELGVMFATPVGVAKVNSSIASDFAAGTSL